MTKQQEILHLYNFIESLPRDSYLHPWLSDIFPLVERDIHADMVPFISPSDLRAEADVQRAEWKARLEELNEEKERQLSNAKEEAQRIVSEAKQRAEEIERAARQSLARDIARLQSALNALS